MAENDGGAPGNAGGNGTVVRPAWLDSAPDAYKNNEAFYAFTEPAKFYEKADALLKAEKSMLVVPGEKATEEEWASFYTKLGRPETADKYTITKPADLPESIPYTPEVEKAFRAIAHQHGLTDAQAKGLHGWFYGSIKAGAEAQAKAEKEATEKAVNTLKDEWKGDLFKTNSELATRAFKAFAGDKPEIVEFLEKTMVDGLALGNHPVFLRVFAEIGKKIGDDALNIGMRGGTGGELSEEEKAKARFPKTKFPSQ